MAKVNLKEVVVLQMDGSYEVQDLRVDALRPLYLDKEKEMVMLQQRLWRGETELSPDEEAIIRKLIATWPWVSRDAIEKQLAR